MREQFDIDGFEFGSMGGYYTYSEIMMELDSMRLLYPDLVTIKQSIGLSIDSLDIWMVKISDNPDVEEDEAEVLYTALHHAREPQSMATVMYFMYYLLENYGTDPFVTFIVDNRELYFVPVVNPDGYVYNEQSNPNGGGMWRKNRRDNDDGSWGVDLNRNYGYMWGYDDEGSGPNPSWGNYRGTEPFSESESQTVRDLCVNHDFKLAFNWHSYWNWIFRPLSYNDSETPDSTVYLDLLANITQYNQYDYSPPNPSGFYLINGDSDDWMYGEQIEKGKILAMTPEVGNDNDGFWPSLTRIYPLAEENVYPNLILALGPGVIDTTNTLYTTNASINSNFLNPGLDTLIVQAELINQGGLPISMQAFIEQLDQSNVDTIQMNDNGILYDNIAGDGIYSGGGISPSNEENYYVDILTQSDSGNVYFHNNIGLFTTIGPVVFEQIWPLNDTIPNAGDWFAFNISLINKGNTGIASNIEAWISAEDSCIYWLVSENPEYGDITPGGTKTMINGYYELRIKSDCDLEHDMPIDIEIASNGTIFWTDSFSIHIYSLDIGDKTITIPKSYVLQQNYPNPFNPITTIQYELPQRSDVQVTIYDLLGRKVITLVSETQDAGYKSVIWDANNNKGQPVSAGIYLYQVKAGEFVQVRKMMVLK